MKKNIPRSDCPISLSYTWSHGPTTEDVTGLTAGTYPVTVEDDTGSGTITIPAGTETADWFFPGDFYGEIGFEIVTPNGNVVGGYSSTEAGPIVIDFCKP